MLLNNYKTLNNIIFSNGIFNNVIFNNVSFNNEIFNNFFFIYWKLSNGFMDINQYNQYKIK